MAKALRIIAYLLISPTGFIIALPLAFWLLGGLLNFSSLEQLFAALATLGIVLLVRRSAMRRRLGLLLLDLAAFGLLISPLAWRMSVVPISRFATPAVVLPGAIFLLAFAGYLFLSIWVYCLQRRSANA